jgi:hypothetical protein
MPDQVRHHGKLRTLKLGKKRVFNKIWLSASLKLRLYSALGLKNLPRPPIKKEGSLKSPLYVKGVRGILPRNLTEMDNQRTELRRRP